MILILLLIFFTMPQMILAGKLDIDLSEDTVYLPYKYVHEFGAVQKNWKHISRPIHLYNSEPDDQGNYSCVIVRNRSTERIDPALFTLQTYPDRRIIDDDPVWMIINDCILHDDPAYGENGLIGAGYFRDTAWIFKLFPISDNFEKKLLTVGEDGNGDGAWHPNLRILMVADYDYDGVDEAFVFLSSEREFTPRLLFCLNTADLSIEWQLEVSSNVYSLYNCYDSTNPGILFSTGNPMQGAEDENYSDRFKYISRIGSRGQILFNKIVSVTTESVRFIEAEKKGSYYIVHPLPFTEPSHILSINDPEILKALFRETYQLSKIDSDCNIICSTEIREISFQMMMHRFAEDEDPVLMIQYLGGIIRTYSPTLELLEESNSLPQLWPKLLTIDIKDNPGAQVFADGIYTRSLKRLVSFPNPYEWVVPMEYDQDSNVVRVILSNQDQYSIGRIEKRSRIELLSIFYHTNQVYILMIMTGLIAGVLVVNFYRIRNKSNLKLISRQKKELEETHQKLKEAQATILAQEKYRQARDIAGGFAHEIRNALSPARNALSRLIGDDIMIAKDISRVQKLTRFTDSAIERAIRMTKDISRYTKIEEMREPEEVALAMLIEKAIEINYHRIEDQGIRINTAIDPECRVLGNKEQFLIVFNNLLLNSLDALTGISEPTILIKSHANDRHVVIEFRDNGSGIDRDSLDRIFDVFYSTKPDRGTGIGLTMAKKIIEIYDGSITVDSVKEKYTSFEIMLKRIQNQQN